MATVDYTVGGLASAVPAEGLNIFSRKECVLDFLSTNTNGVNRTAADILQMIDVANDDYVMMVSAELITAEGGTFTFDVGDGGTVDRFLNGVDGNATAGTMYVSQNAYTQDSTNADMELPTTLTAGIDSILGGVPYTADDTVDMIVNDNVDAAKIRVCVFSFSLIGKQSRANAVV